MKFVIDTVGQVTNENGDTFKGVILAVPADATEDEAREMMRHAARMWAERVEIVHRPTIDAKTRDTMERNANLPPETREIMKLKGMI